MVKESDKKENESEHWMNSKWRPAMGWMYMLVCIMDMVVFPILWSLLQSISHGAVNSQWQPLTLQGAGLFHIAMGAVLGIAAHGRTQEKLNGANNGGLGQPGLGTTYVPPGATPQAGGMNNGGFNSPTSSPAAFNSSAAGGFGSSGGFSASAPTGFGSSPSAGTSSFGSSGGFGDTPQTSAVSSPSVKPIVRRPGT